MPGFQENGQFVGDQRTAQLLQHAAPADARRRSSRPRSGAQLTSEKLQAPSRAGSRCHDADVDASTGGATRK